MPGLSTSTENKVLEALCGGDAYSVANPMLTLVAIAVTEADTAATITEISYEGYAAHTLDNAADMAPASGGVKTNKEDILFPENTGETMPIVVGYALVADGDLVLYGTITPIEVAPGTAPRFPAGSLILRKD